MKRTTHRVTDTSWWKLCPGCKKWFPVLLKPPGTKIRANLPCHCKICSKIYADASKKKLSDLSSLMLDEFNEAS